MSSSEPSTVVSDASDMDEVRRLVLEGLRGQAVRVFLFGSRARKDARSTSDIDVAVLPLAPLPVGLLAQLRERLEQSRILARVDLVDLSDTAESFRERVLSEGVEWPAHTSA